MSDYDFLTSEITVRGKTYKVTEMDAATMSEVRKLLDTEKWRVEAYVAFRSCLDPKFASEKEIGKLPQIVIDKLAAEAFRLTKLEEGDAAKNA